MPFVFVDSAADGVGMTEARHVAAMEDLYAARRIPRTDLERPPDAGGRLTGFLHAESGIRERYSGRNVYAISYNHAGALRGFYSLLLDRQVVWAYCERSLSWTPGREYCAHADLPQTSVVGELSWTNPTTALTLFQAITAGRLAVAGEQAVRHEDEGCGLGGRLRQELYRHVPPERGLVLAETFEIAAVAGRTLPAPAENRTARGFERRGGIRIGTLTETFCPYDGLPVTVRWVLWVPSCRGEAWPGTEPIATAGSVYRGNEA